MNIDITKWDNVDDIEKAHIIAYEKIRSKEESGDPNS